MSLRLLSELSLVLHLARQSGVAGHDEVIISQIDFLPTFYAIRFPAGITIWRVPAGAPKPFQTP
jgi:hypothetical protein